MDKQAIENLCQWESKKSTLLREISELTAQLAEALGRGDQVSVRMVLNMRQEPIQQAEEQTRAENEFLLTLPEEDAIWAAELLKGTLPVRQEEERLAMLVRKNRAALAKLMEEDKQISLRLGGRRSFYQKYR